MRGRGRVVRRGERRGALADRHRPGRAAGRGAGCAARVAVVAPDDAAGAVAQGGQAVRGAHRLGPLQRSAPAARPGKLPLPITTGNDRPSSLHQALKASGGAPPPGCQGVAHEQLADQQPPTLRDSVSQGHSDGFRWVPRSAAIETWQREASVTSHTAQRRNASGTPGAMGPAWEPASRAGDGVWPEKIKERHGRQY
jgi:hypothetical protein